MPDGVAIASEIPALFGVPGIDLSIDPEAVALYLLRNLRHIPDPWTFYTGIRRLPPAHTMTVRGGRIEKIQAYWRPNWEPAEISEDAFLEVFDSAVSQRRMADVEIGALLSGGVDSTAIVDSLRRQGVEAYGLTPLALTPTTRNWCGRDERQSCWAPAIARSISILVGSSMISTPCCDSTASRSWHCP